MLTPPSAAVIVYRSSKAPAAGEDFVAMRIAPPPVTPKPESLENLRADLVAVAADADAAVHHDIAGSAAGTRREQADAAFENPRDSTAPAGMQQCDGALFGREEIDGNAVGDGHGEKHARGGGAVPIHALDLKPALRTLVPAHLGAMDLIAEDHGAEPGLHGAERPPAGHHVPDRGVGPQAEIEAPPGTVTAGGDTGDDAVSLAPFVELEARDGAGEGLFADLPLGCDPAQSSTRSMSAPRSRSR